MIRDGVFTGQPHELFLGSVPRVEDAPAFVFKAVDEAVLSKIQQRDGRVHSRLNSLYPDGERWRLSLAVKCLLTR